MVPSGATAQLPRSTRRLPHWQPLLRRRVRGRRALPAPPASKGCALQTERSDATNGALLALLLTRCYVLVARKYSCFKQNNGSSLQLIYFLMPPRGVHHVPGVGSSAGKALTHRKSTPRPESKTLEEKIFQRVHHLTNINEPGPKQSDLV